MAEKRRNAYYVHGNAVRQMQPDRQVQPDRQIIEKPEKKINKSVKRNRERAKHMNAGYVFYLAVAMAVISVVLVYYIGLQSDITSSVKNIATLEKELNSLKVANEENYNRILSSVDLEEIRRIAVQELGMQYAQEGQIISFASESSDYVKQMAEIPKQD